MPKFFLPRYIEANRGDVLSRYGFLKQFGRHVGNPAAIIVVTNQPAEWLPSGCTVIPPGPFKDLIPRWRQVRLYQKGDIVLWTCGHDMVDESSALLLPYLVLRFVFFKLFGLKIFIVAQGAGPITTPAGKFWIRQIIALADRVSLRDAESLELIQSLVGSELKKKCHLSADTAVLSPEPALFKTVWNDPPVIGINLRRWFHFDGHWMPYEYRRRLGLIKEIPGDQAMQELIRGFSEMINWLMDDYHAQILFVPMYPRNSEPWEDDTQIAQQIQKHLKNPEKTRILKEDIHPEIFLQEIGKIDVMIGMRLHSTVLATSCGIPSIHISYSPKGSSYFKRIVQTEYCIPIETLAYEKNWKLLKDRFDQLWRQREIYRNALNNSLDNLKQTIIDDMSSIISSLDAS